MKNLLFLSFMLLSAFAQAQRYGTSYHFDVLPGKKAAYAADLTFVDTTVTGMLQRGTSLPPLKVRGSVHSSNVKLSFLDHDSVVISFSGILKNNFAEIAGQNNFNEKWQFKYDSTKGHPMMSIIVDTFRYVWRRNKSGTPLGCTSIYQYNFFPKSPADKAQQAVNENLLDDTLAGHENMDELRKIAINAMDDDFLSTVDSYNEAFQDSTSFDQIKYMNEAPQIYTWAGEETRQTIYNKNSLLSIEFYSYDYKGGAHGNYEYTYNNFDLKTGAAFTWEDAFKPNSANQLIILLTQQLRKKYNLKPDQTLAQAGLLVNEVPQPASFFISDYGLGFTFNPYDITPYVYGTTTLYLQWDDLKSIINPAGPLARMIK